MEAGWQVNDVLLITGNMNILDAQLTEDQVSDVVLAPGKDGDRIPYIPETTAMIAATYTLPDLLGNFDGSIRADANYVGSTFSELRPDDSYYLKMDSYTLANLRFNLDNYDSGWGASLYINNVFDKTAITYLSGSSSYPGQFAYSAQPRTVGVTIRKDFF